MSLSDTRHKQGAKATLAFLPIVFYPVLLSLIFSAEAHTASAMRSRVYGFRNADNKEAMQLVGRLGFKVTIDAHSSSVVVLTGDDTEELTRAYTVMEITDQKDTVVLKILDQVADSKSAEVIENLHNQLKTLNVGTLLNPPAKSVPEPMVVDIYQGELIAIAAENLIGKIEEAYKKLKETPSQKPQVSEPNRPSAVPAAKPAITEPNGTEPLMTVAEVNLPEVLTESAPQLPAKTVIEPNKPAEPEIPETPFVVSAVPAAEEPNKAQTEQLQTQEDFISDELLKALAAEEKKVESQKAAITETKPAEIKDVNTIPQSLQDISGDEFKKIVMQLMQQAAQEEKKMQAQPPAQDSAPAVIPEAAPVQKPQEPQTEAAEPVLPEKEPRMEKITAPKTAVRTTTEKASAETPQKGKTVVSEPVIDKAEEELELTITLPEKVEIKQLIELVGKQLGLNYVYDETKIKGDVTLKIHDGKIKVKDCYTLLETVLRYKKFVMTRRGNLVTILPDSELTFSDPKIRTSDEPIEPGDVFINSVFTFKHVKYINVQNILRSLNLGTNVIPIPESNSLIISDYAYRMDKIEQVIKILDVPGTPKTFKYRSLQYMQAADLIPRLQKLAAQMENLSITSGTTAASTPQPAVPTRVDPQTGRPITGAAPQPAAAQSAPQEAQTVYLDADERTNRILMIGNEEQLKMVNDLIDSLDVRQYNLRYVKEYEIKNVDASEVINVLNELGLANVITSGTGQQARQTTAQTTRPGQAIRPGTPQSQPQPQQTGVTTSASTTPDQPSISIRANTNSLLVNATSEQHEDIELVIKHIDVEQKDQRTIKEYEIQNVDAREIVQTLGDLSIISRDSVSNITSSKSSMYDSSAYGSRMGRSGRSGYTTQQPYPQPGQAPEGGQEQSVVVSLPTAEGSTIREIITTEPQISILESTNSLLIYATPRQHASVALVIAHVDREMDRATAPYVVYPLENQDPEELATTLTDLIEGTMKRAATSGPTQQPGMGPSPDARIQTEQTASILPKKEEELIRIIPDVKSYSLIVYANKKNQQWIAALIKQLDQYRPQVLLDCTLVEITKDDQFTMDLNVISKKYGLTTPFRQLTNPITGNRTVTNTDGTALEGVFNSADETTPFSAFYGDNNIQALLEMMDRKSYGRVLARPSILVKDNEEGVIKSEKVTYVAEQKSNVITGEGGQLSETSDVTFKDYTAGVTLTITPHIASEKLMQLEIELDRTDFIPGATTTKIGDTEFPKPLDTTSSNVKTWSLVPSGATIILGGIETVNQNKANTKVPLLGDIPLVGLLFRGIDQTDIQSKLYIFVKANIVKPGDELTGQSDIERISQKKRRTFEEDETRFQGLDSVPGLKPNPIFPEKILEDDEYIQKLKEQQAQGNVITVPIN